MHLDLSCDPDEVEIRATATHDVEVDIAGFTIVVSWDQWLELLEKGADFMGAEFTERAVP